MAEENLVRLRQAKVETEKECEALSMKSAKMAVEEVRLTKLVEVLHDLLAV